MAFVNYKTNEIIAKIVYAGPSMSGKTTNIKYIAEHTSENSRGKLISYNSDNDRTMFYDFLPLLLGDINGYNVRLHLYSIPGIIFYESSQKLILKGTDGVVFVADSSPNRYAANLESLSSLIKNLTSHGFDLNLMPVLFQYNKRDIENAMPKEELSPTLNRFNSLEFESVATQGINVFETLKGITKLILAHIKKDTPRVNPQEIVP